MLRFGVLPLFRGLQTVKPDSTWLVLCCCMASSSRRPSFPQRPFRRVSSRDKDPFGYTFRQRFPRVTPLDSPNLTFEERYRRHATINMEKPAEIPQQEFDFFLVLDFEATCDKPVSPIPQEIIEFPVVKLDAKTMQPVAKFHQYVLPTIHPSLSPFCTKLTGIIQDMVDNQPNLETTLKMFHSWMEKEVLIHPDVRFSFVTCGDWDLAEMLVSQSKHFKLSLPRYFDNWINVKHAFSESVGHYPRSLQLMLDSLGIQHTGRAHSGIDDCTNIVHIMQALANRGHVFRTSSQTKDAAITKNSEQRLARN